VDEPYRMMTARAEYRLLLREDNADERLMPLGRQLGLVDDGRWQAYVARRAVLDAELERLRGTQAYPDAGTNGRPESLGTARLARPTTLAELLRRPEVSYRPLLEAFGHTPLLAPLLVERIETAIKYEGYLHRQNEEAQRFRSLEETALPADADYAAVP